MNKPNNPSSSVKRLNPHLFGPQNCAITASTLLAKSNKHRIRQSDVDMNKLERDLYGHLLFIHDGCPVLPQAIKLRLGNGVWYTPDFIVHDSGAIIAIEAKGPYFRDDAVVKLKVAASAYPFIRFRLVWRDRGRWEYQAILP